jgi:transcription termination factor Rho
MSVLDRAALEQSPLADLHAIASELSLDSYRRLRKEELIDAILERQGAGESAATDDEAEQASARRRRGHRGGRGRGNSRETAAQDAEEDGDASAESEPPDEHREEIAEGVVELLPNGSGFLRVAPPDPSDDDIYVSAAQVRRCELVSGDRVAGPRRPPRRSERFASLLRVDTINGRPATEVADSARFEDLPAAFPSERLPLDSSDLTITAIAELAPIGRGSRVAIVGGPQAGKTEALRRLGQALAGNEELQLWLVLAGVRPEELSDWRDGPVAPAASLSLSASPEAQGQAVEGVVEQARRMTARGGNSVVLIDTLEAVPTHPARRAMASARKLADGGSLTVIATAPAPLGGETTVIGLDAALARAGQFPAIDPAATWTMRRELLAG